MNYTIQHQKKEENDRRKSALITFLVSALIFLGIFFYTFTKTIEKPEQITTMLINFGDNQNGKQTEEPANQEGSLAAEAVEESKPEEQPKAKEIIVEEKIITGKNAKISAPKAEKITKTATTPSKSSTKTTTPKASATKTATPNSKTGTGDGKGTAAI